MLDITESGKTSDQALPNSGVSAEMSAIMEEDSGTSWWVYVLGALAVGALAGGGGDDSSSSPSTTTTPTGEVTVTW